MSSAIIVVTKGILSGPVAISTKGIIHLPAGITSYASAATPVIPPSETVLLDTWSLPEAGSGGRTLPKFYRNREESLHNSMGRELVERHVNQEITLYILDEKKNKRNLYGELVGTAPTYLTPIIIKCRAIASDAELSWDGGKARIGRGDLIIHIYLQQISELELSYGYFNLKRGYYVKYLGEYYKIHDDGSGKREIGRHLGGDRRFYRTLICKKVTAKEFDGR